ARILSHVLPLPAGRGELCADRRSAAPRRRARRGHRIIRAGRRSERRARQISAGGPGPRGAQVTVLAPPVPASAPRWPALMPIARIALTLAFKAAGVPVNNAWIIFTLLVGLMLTGMPISISLGLTVLTYLFAMTNVPIESVALKLFTGIEKFEIMAIPFFILAGTFLTHGGVARRMINFATAMIGHWHGGLGLSGVMACALFAAVSGSSPATVVAIGSVILPAMVKQG